MFGNPIDWPIWGGNWFVSIGFGNILIWSFRNTACWLATAVLILGWLTTLYGMKDGNTGIYWFATNELPIELPSLTDMMVGMSFLGISVVGGHDRIGLNCMVFMFPWIEDGGNDRGLNEGCPAGDGSRGGGCNWLEGINWGGWGNVAWGNGCNDNGKGGT
jgi:hypothetical protein